MSRKLVTKGDVLARVNKSYSTIWQWMIDGIFPRSREVGGESMWFEDEIDAWIESRPIRPLKGEKGAGLSPKVYAVPNPRNRGGAAGKKKRARSRGEARVEA